MPLARLLADLRYGFRQLRLNPGFACLAVVTLALGIGANTALFSVVRSVLLKPLPYREPERLARVWMDNRRLQMREDWASYLNYQDYKRLGTSFESMAAFTEPSLNLIGDGEPERVRGVFAEAALFDVLGAKPIQGRLFTTDEEAAGKENVVVIGWGLWQRRFGRGVQACSARRSISTAAASPSSASCRRASRFPRKRANSGRRWSSASRPSAASATGCRWSRA